MLRKTTFDGWVMEVYSIDQKQLILQEDVCSKSEYTFSALKPSSHQRMPSEDTLILNPIH